jgi:Reverse transcriptase (RNA-dependent DNA polymerase)
MPRSQVPNNEKVLSSVWSMKRKREFKTQQVYIYKARLNVHGRQQEYAVNYFETHAPVVTWPSVRTLLTLSIIHRWCTRQIDFVLAYPQAPIEFDIYMELPKGIETKYGNGRTHVLKLKCNVYDQKQAGRIWNQHLIKGLNSIGFKQSNSDDCVFFRGTTIFAFFADD